MIQSIFSSAEATISVENFLICIGVGIILGIIVSVKKDIKQKEFLDEIRVRNGNMLVMLERQELSEVEL